MAIQIDMFEVQLGAALLLQFEHESGTVRVLADAGVKAIGYSVDHVHQKVLPLFGPPDQRCIDLIIGTHYDEDHLLGLVPIIEDTTIRIGEAWLPPVVNDTITPTLDKRVVRDDLLAFQLSADDGDKVLADYMASKRDDIVFLNALASDEPSADGINSFQNREFETLEGHPGIDWFREQLGTDEKDECQHGVLQEIDPDPEVEEAISLARRGGLGPFWSFPWRRDIEDLHGLALKIRTERPEIGRSQSRTLAHIRKGAAKDAINAKALHAVVQALAARQIPVRYEIIEDGEPRRYRWDPLRRRFLVSSEGSQGLIFDLLGPSRSLVRKHWTRLPVEDAAKVALSFRGEILSITPSNQLSYIGRFGFEEQGILVTGDAGCVDFKGTGQQYWQPLLDVMLPLHVVQVAHHAGNNAHFYRVLAAADFPRQEEKSLLLLSHARHDRTRPSPAFEEFLLSTVREGDDVRLLFTSEPKRSKVVDYLDVIHPAAGTPGPVGDIRVNFENGRWDVIAHAIDAAHLSDPV